jgi:hypothetical protein
VGFPLLTYRFLKKNKDKLDNRENVIKYGLFYIGLRDDRFYWEILVSNFRKVYIVGITVSVSSTNARMQLMLIFSYLYFNH